MRFLLALLMLAFPVRAFSADLEVEVRGVKPRKGEIRAALFANAEDFELSTKIRATITGVGEIKAGVFTSEDDFARPPAQVAQEPATAKIVHLRFTDLEPGDYVAAVFQDLNGDAKLEINLGGRAFEPWGVSNNARPQERAPTSDEAKFALPAEGAAITIDLRLP